MFIWSEFVFELLFKFTGFPGYSELLVALSLFSTLHERQISFTLPSFLFLTDIDCNVFFHVAVMPEENVSSFNDPSLITERCQYSLQNSLLG